MVGYLLTLDYSSYESGHSTPIYVFLSKEKAYDSFKLCDEAYTLHLKEMLNLRQTQMKERLLLQTISNTEVYLKACDDLRDKYNELENSLTKQFYEITRLEPSDTIDDALTYPSDSECGFYFSLTEVSIEE